MLEENSVAHPQIAALDDSMKRKCDRISTTSNFPSLNVFELSGFVRVLNTAGKLALLALVRIEKMAQANQNEEGDDATASLSKDEGQDILCKVSIVDLALEKILTPNHRFRVGGEIIRKVVGQHLSKAYDALERKKSILQGI